MPTTPKTTFSKPKILFWKVIAGEDNLHQKQMFDYILDEEDIRLRFPVRNNKILSDIFTETSLRSLDVKG